MHTKQHSETTTVLWQTRSRGVVDSLGNSKPPDNVTGGVVYDSLACHTLAEHFDFRLHDEASRSATETSLTHVRRLRKLNSTADIRIRDPFVLAAGRMRRAAHVEMAMIHHIDPRWGGKPLLYRWLDWRLKQRLPKMDCVVTVADYWKEHLQSLGCGDVRVIYNSFDLSEFEFQQSELDSFLNKYDLDASRPIIYAGPAKVTKGILEVYNALSDGDYTLVMTGPPNANVKLPIPQLFLERREYLCLLRVCSAVISMSRMLEGWNRIAHEALLCRTPVIGSGTGGMRELLAGGGQTIVDDFRMLPEAVARTLSNRDELARSGYAYASQFDLHYFRNAWMNLVHSMARDRKRVWN